MPRLFFLLVASAALLAQTPAPAMNEGGPHARFAPSKSPLVLPHLATGQSPATASVPTGGKPTREGAEYVAAVATSPSAKVMEEIKTHQQAVSNLQYLCDEIGPRLTGSDRLVQAHEWMESQMKAYGLTNVHREAYEFGPSWTRGVETARILGHNGLNLQVAQMGWNPSTHGPLRGEAILMGGKTLDEMMGLIGHLKGKIVVMGSFPKTEGDPKGRREKMMKLFGAVRSEGIAAFLMGSEKDNGFLSMTGSPKGGRFFPNVPAGFLNKEHANLLKRLLEKHGSLQMELNFGGTFSEKPVQAYNSIGEIRGSEKPDEVVILGAHLDSWDLGTGATDNGTGCVAALEALRAIQASGVKPRRTIRVVLFSGEEQGIFGSKAYVKAHEADLKNIQAVLIDDLGTGKIRGFAMEGREDLRPFMAAAIAPLNEMGVRELPLEQSEDSDHAPFVAVGVPAFFGIQDNEDYFTTTHHSQGDTFEHMKPEALTEGATAMAVTALELANMGPRLPHKVMEKDEKSAPAAH